MPESAAATLVEGAHPSTLGLVPLPPERARALRRVGQQIERLTGEREALIRQAHEDGASYREIGGLVGLSHVGVMKILKKLERGHTPIDTDQRDVDISESLADPQRRLRDARRQKGQGS